MKQTSRKTKNTAGLLITVPGLSVAVTGLVAIAFGLCVSLQGLLVTIPDSRTQPLKVPNWPGKLTARSGTFTDRPAKVTYCAVIFPAQSVSPYLGQARYKIQTDLLLY